MEKKNHTGFSSSLGFVLAAAGSAVGVGNIWRFPYLAAKDGGGLFLLVYIILVLTFGFTLLTTDITLGRRTRMNALKAFGSIRKSWGFLGKLTFLVPTLIMTYYTVIGGWVTRYMVAYATGNGQQAAADGFFTSFITSQYAPIAFTFVFLALTAFIVFNGVEKGVERCSRLVMPGLLLLIVGIALFSLTLEYTTPEGITRTGMDGLAVYLIPDFTGLTLGRFLEILLDAMSQLFFSLSVSMGIMITYGAYVKPEIDLNKAVTQIELCDTFAALMAGMMIIPAVFVFFGTAGMGSGPSLMFISLPKVFTAMGSAGSIVGFIFFLMVAFAALTSCISIMETLVASCMEMFAIERHRMCMYVGIYSAITAAIICLGYNLLYFELPLPNGQTAQILDLADYISNSFLMPFISLLTCIFVGWVIGSDWIGEEISTYGHSFTRAGLYSFMIKYVAPVIMLVLFLQSTGFLGWIMK